MLADSKWRDRDGGLARTRGYLRGKRAITRIGKNLGARRNAEIIDATGKLIFPVLSIRTCTSIFRLWHVRKRYS